MLLASCLLLAVPAGCASHAKGFYHRVQPGENLYRIGLRHGVPARDLARINHIRDVGSLQVGQRLWIPRRPGRTNPRNQSRGGAVARTSLPPAAGGAISEARQRAREEARTSAKLDFGWPITKARLTSRFGRRGGRPHEGVDLAAGRGTTIRAAEAGKVIHSGRLGDYGNVVIVKHAGNYRTVYAHASKLLVRKGQFVDRGQGIAEVGSTGRASGPHLHFEIRKRETPRDPMLYLP